MSGQKRPPRGTFLVCLLVFFVYLFVCVYFCNVYFVQVVSKAEKAVQSAATNLGVVSLGMACLVAPNREVERVQISIPAIPNTPLETFLNENKSFVLQMKAALRSTQLLMSCLWAAKLKGDKKEFARLLKIDLEAEEEGGEGGGEEEDLDDLTPPLPILQMGLDQVTPYFAKLMKRLLQMEGEGRLWAGKDKPAGKMTIIVANLQLLSPYLSITGKINFYDDVAERILERDHYRGRGTGGEGIAGKLRLVTCYLLQQIGKDYNTFHSGAKPGFRSVVLDFTTMTSADQLKSYKGGKAGQSVLTEVRSL